MASETTITVRRTANSTPLRKFDYDAWYGDLDLGVTVGHGATPNEAIQNLEEQVEEREEDKFLDGHRCTSDCRRVGCEVVHGWQRRAEAH